MKIRRADTSMLPRGYRTGRQRMAKDVLAGIAMLVIAQGLVGCSGSGSAPSSSPSFPSAPSRLLQTGQSLPPVIPPQPPPVTGISGFVLDTGFRPLGGATVTVVDGPRAGTSTTADAGGQFSLAGAFDNTTRFRAMKEGHVTATQTWSCSVPSCPDAMGSRPWLGFYLASLGQPVSLTGDYTLTLIADSACTDIPDEFRTRTYSATITPSTTPNTPIGTSFTAMATGAAFLGTHTSFLIGVVQDYVDLWLHGGHDAALVEQLGPNTYLAFSGNAKASVGASPVSNLTTSFEGWIDYCVMKAPMGAGYNCGTSNTTGEPIPGLAMTYAHCESTNHRLILRRR